ncbi:MAG: hypothetical protein AABW80_04405 [Nanoarchaeota archaeon]
MDNNLILQAADLEKQIHEMENHLKFVDTQLTELSKFGQEILQFNNSNSNSVLTSLGKGVYVPAQISEKELFVEVGAGVVVKKTPEQLVKVIEAQVRGLNESREYIISRLESSSSALQELVDSLEKEYKE